MIDSCTGLDRKDMPTGVYPGVGRFEGSWIAFYLFSSGGSATSHHPTKEAAEAEIEEHIASSRQFWTELAERAAKEKLPNGLPRFIRADKVERDGMRASYAVSTLGIDKTTNPNHLGFAGRVFRWHYLDDPTGTVYESNNVYYQGLIPAEHEEILPVNIEWVQHQGPVFMGPA